jgi:hypothetical protein
MTSEAASRHVCRRCNRGQRWYPYSIERWNEFFQRLINDKSVSHKYELRRNLAYNMQYLQYLSYTIDELDMSSVIITQTFKSFIITGVSVIEGIFHYLILKHDLQRKNHWDNVKELTSSEYGEAGSVYRHITTVQRKRASPEPIGMSFERMARRVEEKKLLGGSSTYYRRLHALRKLRNRVHLQLVDDAFDTDWKAFNRPDFDSMQELLYDLLSGSLFKPTKAQLDMLEFLST